MILRELREIDQATDDILIYGYDGSDNQKISTDTSGKLDIVSANLDTALSTLKTVLDNIDANTDTLEAKTQSIRDQLDVVLSTRASESTALSVLNAIGEASGTNILTELQTLITDVSDLAKEDTLIEVRDSLDTVEAKLQTIIDSLDVNLSTRASESTLASVLSELESIDGKDFATESTLALIKTAIDAINTDIDVALSTRSSENTSQSILDALGEESGTNVLNELQNLESTVSTLATEATLALIKTAIDSINTDIDVALSTRASEVTLLLVKTNLDDIKIKLDTLIATDFATEATSTEILNTIGQESGVTVLSRLLDIWNKLVSSINEDRTTNLDGQSGINTNAMLFGRVSDSIVKNARLDSSTEAMIGIDYPHHDLHAGSFYTYSDLINLGNGASQDYILTQPDTDKHGHWGYEIEFLDGAGTFDLYRNTDRIGTTLQNIYNSNDNFPDDAGVTVHKDQSGGTTDGIIIISSRKGSGKSFGGVAGTQTERILKRNTKYLIRVTNNTVTSNYTNIIFRWYEHTPRN